MHLLGLVGQAVLAVLMQKRHAPRRMDVERKPLSVEDRPPSRKVVSAGKIHEKRPARVARDQLVMSQGARHQLVVVLAKVVALGVAVDPKVGVETACAGKRVLGVAAAEELLQVLPEGIGRAGRVHGNTVVEAGGVVLALDERRCL